MASRRHSSSPFYRSTPTDRWPLRSSFCLAGFTPRRSRSAPSVELLNRGLLDLVVLLETDHVLHLLPHGDPFVLGHAGVVAGALQLLQRFLHEVELDADREDRIDAAGEAHVLELHVAVERALVAVAAALHVTHRHCRQLARL